MDSKVINGDSLIELPRIDSESIHLTFTSPPYYNARDYSHYDSYKDYLFFLNRIINQIHRVTKEGRFFIVNSSPVITPRLSRQHKSVRHAIPFDLHPIIVGNGFEFIDDIIWQKPDYSVKNRVGGFMQHRNPLAYKPNSVTEYIMVYRKETAKLIDWNIRQYDNESLLKSKVKDGFERTNIWKLNPKSSKEHPAIFPKDLCSRIIEYYSFTGDIILDPFAGSGTVAVVAKELDRNYLLIEQNKEYYNNIIKNLSNIFA